MDSHAILLDAQDIEDSHMPGVVVEIIRSEAWSTADQQERAV